MEKLEDMCVWKSMANNPNSTTFYDVRACETDHPLKKCLECDGTKPIMPGEGNIVKTYHLCTDYVALKSLYNLRKIL